MFSHRVIRRVKCHCVCECSWHSLWYFGDLHLIVESPQSILGEEVINYLHTSSNVSKTVTLKLELKY